VGGKQLKKALAEEKQDKAKAFHDFKLVLGTAANVVCDCGPHL